MEIKKYLVNSKKPIIWEDELEYEKGDDVLFMATKGNKYVAWLKNNNYKLSVKNAEYVLG